MRATLFISILILSFNISAQQDSMVISCYMLDSDIYSKVDTNPEFPGGNEKLFDFLRNNLKYPTCDACNNGIVYSNFIINEDGSISDIKILKGINDICDKEAVRVIGLMPNWIPGINQNKKVKVYYSIPIKFSSIK